MRHFKEKAVRLFKNAPQARKIKFYIPFVKFLARGPEFLFYM